MTDDNLDLDVLAAADLGEAIRGWCVCCPACGQSEPWTNGTETQVWCQVCGTEFEAPDYLVAAHRIADALPALFARARRCEELEAMRCDCDEESGQHKDTCAVFLKDLVRGVTDENEQLRARVAELERKLDAMQFSLAHETHFHRVNRDGFVAMTAKVAELERQLADARNLLVQCQENLDSSAHSDDLYVAINELMRGSP